MSGAPTVGEGMASCLSGPQDRLYTIKETSKPGFKLSNVFVGAAIQLFEVSTLGQPFEVLKTHMAGNLVSLSIPFLL